MFLPDDRRLRHFGHTIADARRHSLQKDTRETEGEREQSEAADQMSLFAVHSATASELDAEAEADIFADDDHHEPELPESDDLVIDLTTVPLPGGGAGVPGFGPAGGTTDRNERDRLRRLNTDLAKQLVDLTGMPHKSVNGELNRRAGVTKIAEATIVQLNKRSRAAEEWLRQETRRRRFSAF